MTDTPETVDAGAADWDAGAAGSAAHEAAEAAHAAAADSAAAATDSDLKGAIEALLFVSDEPVSATTLAKILERNPTEIDALLSTLSTRFEEEERGIQLREVAGGWRLYSHPAYHDIIERYVISWDTRSLSQAALEALAVVAYHQPTTRAAVNGIRGVNSDAVISSLMEKGLVREAGRDSGPGNAILYATTRTFLEKFGLKSLKDLPPLEDFAPDAESREYIRARLSSGQAAPGATGGDGQTDDFDDDDLDRAERTDRSEAAAGYGGSDDDAGDDGDAGDDDGWAQGGVQNSTQGGADTDDSEDLEFVD